MAKCNAKVWLGFDDEYIHEKYKCSVNNTTNKIGGKPDFPIHTSIETPTCSLCQLSQALVVQIYAPIEETSQHRTLYVFACINPTCWNKSESWTCLRAQSAETFDDSTEVKSPNAGVIDWCPGADDWNDDNANFNEQNGNVINAERVSDEDDESFSFEESLRCGLGNLKVDDQNANTGFGEAQGGAVGKLSSPSASAEIEGDEGEVVTIDTPTIPQHNIAALLQEVTPLPQEISDKSQIIQFVPYFMNVYEETVTNSSNNDHHIRDLLQEYKQNSDDGLGFMQEDPNDSGKNDGTMEKYEKASPAHGDKLFHYFLTRIQMNPGQILRYSREDSQPLLIAPLQEIPPKCKHCQGELTFEFQILPTIIPKLRLVTDAKEVARVEFGNVLVFTCKRSCWSTDSTVRQEFVIVQKEVY